MKQFTILRTANFRPHKRPTRKLIHSRILNYIEKLSYIKPIAGIYGDMRAIAKFFNLNLKFCNKMKFSGLALGYNITIYSGVKRKNSLNRMRETFCHELAHTIQTKFKVYCCSGLKKFYLSSVIRYEQEAVAISKLLFKIFFPNQYYSIQNDKTYFSPKDYRWLNKFYFSEGIINDLYKWQR